MDEEHRWCPDPSLPDDAFWKEVNTGFGQETWEFAVYMKYDEIAEQYVLTAHADASGYYEDEDVLDDPPDVIRINLPSCSWGGLAREVPSGEVISKILRANAELLVLILDAHDVTDGSLTEEAIDALVELETAFEEAAEYEEFWNVEERAQKQAVAPAEPVEYDDSFWNADLMMMKTRTKMMMKRWAAIT